TCCSGGGFRCSSHSQCCTGVCAPIPGEPYQVGEKLNGVCTCATSGPCQIGAECCTGTCSQGACICFNDGTPCTDSDQCCSGACSEGICCTLPDATCGKSSVCCGGSCFTCTTSGQCTYIGGG